MLGSPICSRIVDHVTSFPFDRVYFMQLEPGDLDDVEQHWIKRLQPKYNTAFNKENIQKNRNKQSNVYASVHVVN